MGHLALPVQPENNWVRQVGRRARGVEKDASVLQVTLADVFFFFFFLRKQKILKCFTQDREKATQLSDLYFSVELPHAFNCLGNTEHF